MPRHTADEEAPVAFLESGDRLTRSEFERRYAARPDIKKAELIEGIVYVPSPTRHVHHGHPHAHVVTWLGVYAARTPGVQASDNATLRMDLDNEPQPDALLRLEHALGGRSHVDADDFLDGSPELIIEVASSSASYDAGPKKNACRRDAAPPVAAGRSPEQTHRGCSRRKRRTMADCTSLASGSSRRGDAR